MLYLPSRLIELGAGTSVLSDYVVSAELRPRASKKSLNIVAVQEAAASADLRKRPSAIARGADNLSYGPTTISPARGNSGGPHTAHTIIQCRCSSSARATALNTGSLLADIAPTLLELMELPKPKEMTGTSLLKAD